MHWEARKNRGSDETLRGSQNLMAASITGVTSNLVYGCTIKWLGGRFVAVKRGSAMPRTGIKESYDMADTRNQSFLREHSLSIASVCILVAWIILYVIGDPSTHLGSFFGNAIADWTGVVVTIFATKYLYERGSAESLRPPHRLLRPVWRLLRDHSLSIFLLITGLGWVALYVRMDSEAKWGQVVGNIVSEWTQIFGLVLLTKRLIERHSKESAK
jgi:prolipoprotein diacylglyceryltransferase